MDVYGLIGFPLEHSFSKKYFEEKFRKDNIEHASFDLFPLAKITDFKNLQESRPDLKGLAVTIPYKVDIIPFLSQLTTEAGKIGAVNCIQVLPGKLIGHNTDAIGFEHSLLPLLVTPDKGALILGKGGAAKAVRFVLEKLAVPFKFVTRDLRLSGDHIHYDHIDEELLNKFPLLINCTPVGMYPFEQEKPAIPYHLLTPDNVLYDLIYNPEETLFLKEGKNKGCKIKNGLEMLFLQAEENWKIWTQ